MTQKSLSKWLKGIILGITVCGIIIYGFLIPMFGKDLAVENRICTLLLSLAGDVMDFCYSLLSWTLSWMEDYGGDRRG